MNKEIKNLNKRRLLAIVFIFLLLFVFLGEYDSPGAQAKDLNPVNEHVAVASLEEAEEIRLEITGDEVRYDSLKHLANRVLSMKGAKALITPVLLVLSVIILSFAVVEYLINKQGKK